MSIGGIFYDAFSSLSTYTLVSNDGISIKNPYILDGSKKRPMWWSFKSGDYLFSRLWGLAGVMQDQNKQPRHG